MENRPKSTPWKRHLMLMSYSKVKGGDIDLAPAEICCLLLHSLWSLRTQSKIKLLFFTRIFWLRQEEAEQHHQWLFCAQGETQLWHAGEKQQLCWNIISEISARYFNHFCFCPPYYYHLLFYYYFTILILDFLLLLIHTFVIPTITPGKKKVK